MRLAIPLILCLHACGAMAQDGEAESESESSAREAAVDDDSSPERCIRTRSIRRTRIVDDQTIIFYMRNRDVYVNSLPRTCPQLASAGRFAYQTRAGALCDSDVITVLMQFAGRFEPGFTCRLGQFVPSDPETVEIMIEAAESGGAAPPVRGEAVELPPEEAEEAED